MDTVLSTQVHCGAGDGAGRNLTLGRLSIVVPHFHFRNLSADFMDSLPQRWRHVVLAFACAGTFECAPTFCILEIGCDWMQNSRVEF